MGKILMLAIAIFFVKGVTSTMESDSLKFFAFGDWGGLPTTPYKTYVEAAVSAKMGKMASLLNIDHLLVLGDNFYFDGVKNMFDPRFKETYEDVFTAPVFNRTRWFMVAGNHDHYGNVTAQLAYARFLNPVWYYPSLYYNVTFRVPGSDKVVDVAMVDTVVLCGNSHDFDPRSSQPTGPDDVSLAEQQWAWLEDFLANSKADYLLVAGHFPVYSVAEHGPTSCLVDRLRPMLYKYKVDAYICGHDHNLQHIEVSGEGNWTVEYFLVGAANFIDGSLKHANAIPPGSLRFHWADYLSLGGFGYMDITDSALTFSYLESTGKLLHKQTIAPRRLKVRGLSEE